MADFRGMRRFKQQTDMDTCRRVLTSMRRGILSMAGTDGYPYAIPMNFYYDEADNAIYFHSAMEGHKIDALRENDRACFTVMDEGFKKDGDWAWYVNSVVAFGTVEIMEDREYGREKALKLADKYFPDEVDIDEEMTRYHRTQMLAFHIEHMTGKLVHEN